MSALPDRALVIWMMLLVVTGAASVLALEVAQRQVVMPILSTLLSVSVVMLSNRQLRRASGRLRRLRLMSLLASVAWMVGTTLWLGSFLITGQPAAGLVDVLFVIAYVPMLGMVAVLVRPGTPHTDRVRLLLDVLVFMVGGGLILWDLARIWSPNALNSAAYLLMDLAMLSLVVSLLALRHTTGLWPGMWMILAGIAVAAGGDALLIMGIAPHPLVDAGWLAEVVLLQAAIFGGALYVLPCQEPNLAEDVDRLPRGRSVSLIIG